MHQYTKGERKLAGKVLLKKGPWSEEEDAILRDYVEKHGKGNWNAIQKFTSLSRCGKSCRLRWVNHLRPDLKKCTFSPAEQRRIIELHAKRGPKWSRMAAELPGRTDNEIKNFWNTRCKRLLREGLPLYPHDVSVETQQTETPESREPTPFPNGNISSLKGLADIRYDEIEEFKIPQNLLDVQLRNMLPQAPKPNLSYSFSNMFPCFHPQGPVPSFGLPGSQSFNHMYRTTNGLTEQNQESNLNGNRDPNLEQHQLQPQPHELSTVNGFPSITDNPTMCFNPNSHAHADMNGYSFGCPHVNELSFGSTMMELPSIQKPVSDFSFCSPHIPPPQDDPSMLQPVATHQEITKEITDPEEKIIDDFFNFDTEIETCEQHDAPIGPCDQISAMDTKTQEVHTSITEQFSRPTVSDSGEESSYQLDMSAAPDEWLDGNVYTMLDAAMAAFISDEDVTLTPIDL